MQSPYLRGFTRENLLRGFVAAIVVATVITVVIEALVAFMNASFGRFTQILPPLLLWLYLAIVWFILITLFHAALHAFFAFLHERGEAASDQDDHASAVRYLYLFSLSGNHHYDESGDAHRTLLASYLHLRKDQQADQIVRRCESLGFETDLEAKD